MSEIITQLPESFLREFEAEVLGQVPEEKAQAELKRASIGRVLASEGALAIQGLGQKLGEIDARTYFRWQQNYPGCWDDKAFVREFYRDNPSCKSPGWTPKTSPARNGFTFVGGAPVR